MTNDKALPFATAVVSGIFLWLVERERRPTGSQDCLGWANRLIICQGQTPTHSPWHTHRHNGEEPYCCPMSVSHSLTGDRACGWYERYEQERWDVSQTKELTPMSTLHQPLSTQKSLYLHSGFSQVPVCSQNVRRCWADYLFDKEALGEKKGQP